MYQSKFIILLIVWCYANSVNCTPVALQTKSTSTLTDDLIQNKGSQMLRGYSPSYLHVLNGNTFLDPLALKRRKRQVDNKESDASKNEEIEDISVAPGESDPTTVVTKEIVQSLPEVDTNQNEPSAQIEPPQLNEPSPENQAPTNNESSPDEQNITEVKDVTDDEVIFDEKIDLPDTVSTVDMSETVPTDPMPANPIDFYGDTLISSDISKEPTIVALETNIPRPELDIPIDAIPIASVDSEISEEPTPTGEDEVSTANTLASEQDISPDTELFTPAVQVEDISENLLESSFDADSTPNDIPATDDLDSDTTSSDTLTTPNISEEAIETQLDSANTPNVSEIDVPAETVPATTGSTTPEITESTDTVATPNTSELESSTDVMSMSLDTATTPKISEQPTTINLDEESMPNPSELDVPTDSIPNVSSKTTTDTSSTPGISEEPLSESTLDIVGEPNKSDLDDSTDTTPDMSPNSQDQETTSKSDIEMPVAIDTPNKEDEVSTPETPPPSTSHQGALEFVDTQDVLEDRALDTTNLFDHDEPDEDTSMATKSVDGQEASINSDKQNSESVAAENVKRNNGISSTDKRPDFDMDEYMNAFEELLEESDDSVITPDDATIITPEEDTVIDELNRRMIESMKADPADFLTKYETLKENYKLPAEVKKCICSTSNNFDFMDDYQHDREYIDFLYSHAGRFNNKKYESIARKYYDDDFVDFEHFIEE